MKTALTVIIASIALVFLSFSLLTTTPGSVRAGDGTVLFSHATHKDLAECATCHEAAKSESARDNLLPKAEICATCHDAKDVRTYWSLGDDADLATTGITAKDKELIFAHAPHLANGGMQCTQCHTGIASDGAAYPTMETCAGCHNGLENLPPIVPTVGTASSQPFFAGNACESCHTTLVGLMPQNHRTALFSRLHGKTAMNGEADRECGVCHSQSFCQECHTPTNDVPAGVAADRFYLDSWPRARSMDDSRMLTVQTAHSLTYRYTHGFDARAQSSRCATCHDAETFCTPCHRNGYDATGTRIVPQSHQLAGFASVTGGKAMNRHAKLAEMDIAACATCHEVDAGDPVCAICHSTGVVKGEN